MTRLRRLCAAAVAGVVFAGAAVSGAANLGPHGGLAPDGESACRGCHLRYPDDLGVGYPAQPNLPRGGAWRLADPQALFCWTCHRVGNPYGAPGIERFLDTPGHDPWRQPSRVPDAWAVGGTVKEQVGLRSRESRGSPMSCQSCHDVHDHGLPDFLRPPAADGDPSPLCAACHAGRENPGLLGLDNIQVRQSVPYSTHPTGPAPAAGCHSCHDVHGPTEGTVARVSGLLRLRSGESASALCRRCHPAGFAGQGGGHPTGALAVRRLPPDVFPSNDGAPRAWGAVLHLDNGAQFFSTGGPRGPDCTSCHDAHGGLPMTSLLYGPNPVDGGNGDWCFSCHPAEALHAVGHGGATPTPKTRCTACHGGLVEGRSVWGAHRSFALLDPSESRAAEAGASRPLGTAEGEEVGTRLAGLLIGPRPEARAAAADMLARLRPPHLAQALMPALADPRPDVRAGVSRFLGSIGGGGAEGLLLAVLRDGDATVREAAVRALGGVGAATAASSLYPLLGDPEAPVRRAAAAALGQLGDPGAIARIVPLLSDPSEPVRREAIGVLADFNDPLALTEILGARSTRASLVPEAIQVIGKLSAKSAVPALIAALGHPHRLIRLEAAAALGRHRDPQAAAALIGALADPDGRVRGNAMLSLGAMGDPAAAGPIAAALRDGASNPMVRATAARALGQIPSPVSVAALIAALGDRVPAVGEAANLSLERLTCRNFGADQGQWSAWWEGQTPTFPLGSCR